MAAPFWVWNRPYAQQQCRTQHESSDLVETVGALEHDGSWAGIGTYFAVSADRSHSVAVGCNTDGQDPTSIADEIAGIWA